MKVIIAGGRDFNNFELLVEKCDNILSTVNDVEIVCGKAAGADTLGEQYAKLRGYKVAEFPADWSIGKSAGYLRNKQMAEYADALIVFWDGCSRGSKHMIDLANQYKLKVRIINYVKNT